MDLRGSVEKFALKHNICAGVGRADRFDALKAVLRSKKVPFVAYDIDRRTDPSLTMPDAKSIIAVGVPYNKRYIPPNDSAVRGCISSAAVGEDYHTVLMRIMEELAAEVLHGCNYMCFTDTGPLADREAAKRCGLGFIGKNHSLINEKMGGMLFLGYILTNAAADEYDAESGGGCGNCDRCIRACPGGALSENGFVYEHCIAYITQCRGELSEKQMSIIGRQIYGCDICQLVCPYNKCATEVSAAAYPDIDELLHISNRRFKALYGCTAAGWRGKNVLRRNALAVLGNMGTDRARAIAEEFIDDERQEIAAAARRCCNAQDNKKSSFS